MPRTASVCSKSRKSVPAIQKSIILATVIFSDLAIVLSDVFAIILGHAAFIKILHAWIEQRDWITIYACHFKYLAAQGRGGSCF